MRDSVKRALDKGDERLSSLAELRNRPELEPTKKTMDSGHEYFEGGAEVGRYFLFASMDRARQAPFAANYFPLSRYPAHIEAKAEGGRVPLPLIAQEMAEAHAKRAQHHPEFWTDEPERAHGSNEGREATP